MTIHELLALTGLTESDEIPVWDEEASGEPTKKITAQNFAAAIKTLASLLGTGDVVNDLTNSDATKVASQKEAYDLNNMFNASSYTAWSATGQTSGDIYLARYGKVRLLSFSDVVVPSGATFSITEFPVGDRPIFLTVGSLRNEEKLCVSIWVQTTGTFGYASALLGHTINGQIVWIAA